MYMIKYVLLTLGPPAKGAVLQKRRHLIFQYLGDGSSVCRGSRGAGLGLAPLLRVPARFGTRCCCGQRLGGRSALGREVCAVPSSAKWGQNPPRSGSPSCCALLLRGLCRGPCTLGDCSTAMVGAGLQWRCLASSTCTGATVRML